MSIPLARCLHHLSFFLWNRCSPYIPSFPNIPLPVPHSYAILNTDFIEEKYRSGHNGAHSKIFEKVSVLSTKNPVFLRAYAVRKTEYFAVLSVSSFQKFWERFSDRHMESCPSGRRCSTRNAVSRKGPRVRIPNSPPESPVNMRVCWTFLFCSSSENTAKSWKEQAVFWRELGGFWAFFLHSNPSISPPCCCAQFRPICCRNLPFQGVAYRLPSPALRTAWSCSQGGRRYLPWWKNHCAPASPESA